MPRPGSRIWFHSRGSLGPVHLAAQDVLLFDWAGDPPACPRCDGAADRPAVSA
jgi:hypothetical protein